MNLIEITDGQKRKLGSIINYYRITYYKENNPDAWSINNFVREGKDLICSPSTLSAIENNKVIKDTDIYDKLPIKLGQEYNYQKDLTNLHEAYQHKLITAFEQYDSDATNKLIDDYILDLAPYRHYIFEKEVYTVLKIMKEKLTTNSDKIVDKVVHLFEIYGSGIQIVLSSIIYSYFYNYKTLSDLEDLDAKLGLTDSQSLRLQSLKIHTLIRKKYFFEATKNLLRILMLYEESNHFIGYLHASSLKLHLLVEINSDEWTEEVSKILPVFKANIENYKDSIVLFIYNIAMGYLKREEYVLANELLIFILNNTENFYLPTAIYINMISTILDKPVPKIASRTINNEEFYSEPFIKIYGFYERKNKNTPPIELEDYIIREIYPLFHDMSDASLYDAFRLELEKCIAITGHNHLLYNYNRIRRRSSPS